MYSKKQKLRRMICSQGRSKVNNSHCKLDSFVIFVTQAKHCPCSKNMVMQTSGCLKKISFSDRNRVILIPTIQDYRSSGLHEELWWQPSDLDHFKVEATHELMRVMKDHNLDVKSALSYLYQTHDLDTANSSCQTTTTDSIISFSSESDDDASTESSVASALPLHIELGLHHHNNSKRNESMSYVHPLAVLAL
jgi:hypothetical protein